MYLSFLEWKDFGILIFLKLASKDSLKGILFASFLFAAISSNVLLFSICLTFEKINIIKDY